MSSSERFETGETTTVTIEYLTDSDVVSFMFRGDTRGEPYREFLHDKRVGISFMTVAELRRWMIQHGWGEQRREHFARFLDRFTVFYSDDALCTAWAAIVAYCNQAGQPIAPSDAWVAAAAWLASIPLVTHNVRHFRDIPGLEVISFQST